MYYDHDDERDPFDAFRTPEAAGEGGAPETASAAPSAIEHTRKALRIRTGFSWAGFFGASAALAWLVGAIGGPLSYFGANAILAMEPLMQAGLVAIVIGPALLFWVCASAAAEALKARRIATTLTRLIDEWRAPLAADSAARLGRGVSSEIETLNATVAAAIDRLAELEQAAKRNAVLFGDAVHATRDTSDAIAHAIKRERDAMLNINGDIKGQTEDMANAIGRQIRLMRETSKLVHNEVAAAEQTMQAQRAAIDAAAEALDHRMGGLENAGAELNNAMSNALDGLSEATRLTETARKSTEQAAATAVETAAAVNETTRAAVFEAKRAAQFIRAEAASMQDTATETLAKLREAADLARAAAVETKAAANRHAAPVEDRVATRTPAVKKVALASTRGRGAEAAYAESADYGDSAHAPSHGAGVRRASKGFSAWASFNASRQTPPMPANEDDGRAGRSAARESRVSRERDFDFIQERRDPDLGLKNAVYDLLANAGVDLNRVLRPSDLDGVARRAQGGIAARRRAVADAAPSAVNRIVRYVRSDIDAKAIALEFRARPDLAKNERDDEGADLVRAYLLIDAALAN
jgi:hypothetical protein